MHAHFDLVHHYSALHSVISMNSERAPLYNILEEKVRSRETYAFIKEDQAISIKDRLLLLLL